MSDPEPAIRHPRRSRCADAALRAEIKRISQMTVEERVNAALTMRGRFDWLRTKTETRIPKEK